MQQYINRKCESAYQEIVTLINIWYKSNTNNFPICQRSVQLLFLASIRFHKIVSVSSIAYMSDDVFRPDKLSFGSDAGCELCCM